MDIKLFCCSFSNSYFRIFHMLPQVVHDKSSKEYMHFKYVLLFDFCVYAEFLIKSNSFNRKVASLIYYTIFRQRLISCDNRFAFDPSYF